MKLITFSFFIISMYWLYSYLISSGILLDIDNFKNVNDKHGHLVGDKVILFIAETLKKYTRRIDVVGRWGGEEFIIICPKTNKEEASKVAEKIKVKIENNQMGIKEFKSASFGLSSCRKDDSIHKLLSRADEAMYISKNKGKNKITVL